MSSALAVAVVSWNTRELLRACLASLAADSNSGLAEVWVVDNGSDDGSPEMVASEFPWVRLEARSDNLGFGRAVNLVAERSNAPWLAAANADLEFEPGALERLLRAGERQPRAAAVAPRLVMSDGRTQHSVHPFPTLSLGLVYNLGLARVIPGLGDWICLEGYWDDSRARRVDWAHGALLLLRRAAFDQVGGFDERQWMYAEDLDLCWRLAGAGWATLYEPAARVRHEVSAATRQAFADERHGRHIAAAYTWMARRRGIAVARAYAALNWTGAAGRRLGLAPLARLDSRRFAAAAERQRRYMALHRQGLRPLQLHDTHLARKPGAP